MSPKGRAKKRQQPLRDETTKKISYTMDKAYSFKHSLKINNPSIQNINRLLLSQKKSSKDLRSLPGQHNLFARTDPKGLVVTGLLNRLTMEKFHESLELLLDNPMFGTPDATQFFVKSVESVVLQQLEFIPMYSKFIAAYRNRLPSPESREVLKLYLTDLCEREYTSNSFAFFIGSLAKDNLVGIFPIFERMMEFIRDESDSSAQKLYYLFITIGKEIEQSFLGAGEIISTIREWTKSQVISMRVRFMLKDLMEAIDDHWNMEPLLPKMVTLHQVKDSFEKEEKSKSIENAIENYVSGGQLMKTINEDYLLKLVKFMSELPTMKFDRLREIFRDINANTKLSVSNLVNAFNKAIEDARENAREFPTAVRKCGAMIARSTYYKVIPLSHFGTSIPYSYDVMGGFLSEMDSLDGCEFILTTEWLKDLQFLPEKVSHFQFLQELSDLGMTSLIPCYDLADAVYRSINESKSVEELTDIVNNYDDQTVATSLPFIEFLSEMLVIHKPTKYVGFIIRCLSKMPPKAIRHIEILGDYYKWSEEHTKAQVKGLSSLLKVAECCR